MRRMIRFILIGAEMWKNLPDHPAIEWTVVDNIDGGNPITASIANSYGRIDSSSIIFVSSTYFAFNSL